MGVCVYCGENAGVFRTKHPSCEGAAELHALDAQREREQSLKEVSEISSALNSEITDYLAGSARRRAVEDAVGRLAAHTRGSVKKVAAEFILATLARDYLAGGKYPSATVEDRCNQLADHLGLDIEAFDPGRTWIRFVMHCVMRDLDEGKFPTRVRLAGTLPFLLEKKERVCWGFPGAQYLQDKVVRNDMGSIVGISTRVHDRSVIMINWAIPKIQASQSLVWQDEGLLVVTDRALYFKGVHKALKVRLKDVVTLSPYTDGFDFCKGGITARRQVFQTGADEGWFAYALVKAMAQSGSELD
jgi:hypothetical protein